MISYQYLSGSVPKQYRDFVEEWMSQFNLSYLTPLAKEKLRAMFRDPKYNDLKTSFLCSILGISHQSGSRFREGNPKQPPAKRGPKPLIDLPSSLDLIEASLERRKQNLSVSIKWAESHYLRTHRFVLHRKPSRWTYSRIYKRHRWKRRRAQRRHPYYLSSTISAHESNFISLLYRIFSKFSGTCHIMDESGVHTNLFPHYTFASPQEKDAYVKAHPDETKDTIMVTLSSNGNGDLFYVPFQRASGNEKGRSGVGNAEMAQWTRHFIDTIGKPGDILILDNLNSHHCIDFVNEIEQHGIMVLFFPIRTASKFKLVFLI